MNKIEDIFNKSYDKNEFIRFYKPFKDLRSALEDLEKDPNNADARQDIGSILYNNPKQYTGMNADILKKEGKGDLDSRVNQLVGWIENGKIVDGHIERNIDAFLSKLEVKELYGIARRSQPCKNENSEHDKKVDLQVELAYMDEVARKEDVNSMINYIANQIKLQNNPGLLDAFLSYSSGDSDYVKRTFANYMGQKERELQMKFVSNGEINKSKLASYIKDNLEAIKREVNKETDLGDKGDLYDLIKPTYISLAEAGYSKDKREKEKDEDPTRESRKEKRAELGLPF